jgi:hypothetical protein
MIKQVFEKIEKATLQQKVIIVSSLILVFVPHAGHLIGLLALLYYGYIVLK